MDLRFPTAAPTPDEVDALDRVLGRTAPGDGRVEHRGLRVAKQRRHLLLPALHALVDRVGHVSEGGLGELCRRLDLPPAEAYGVASFYSMFPLEPVPPRTVYVCEDLACSMADGSGDATTDRNTRIVPSPCLGQCDRAPARLVTQAGPEPTARVVARHLPYVVPQQGAPELRLLRRVGIVHPSSLREYEYTGGFVALRRALAMGPQRVIDTVMASGLVGRGGAAFPTGRKWAAVASQPTGPKFVVANADESEPGTFKDRTLIEGDPFSLVESLTIAGWAVGATKGYIYLRGEYSAARTLLMEAIDAARWAGYLGESVCGTGFAFDIELVRGAGAYICGEETALFESIEGRRGEPRSKPPFPVEVGLFGRPTLVNNVETLYNAPLIIESASGYSATKLFCVSGAVERPGVYEVSFGAAIDDLIEMAGGVSAGRFARAVLLGGAAGTFVGPDRFSMPLTFEATRAAGLSLGSGVVMVIDDATPIEPLLRTIAAFFRHESCGQCVPCRVGTVRQQEIVERLAAGTHRVGDLELLNDVGRAMRDASICGLGQTAWNAIESAIVELGVWR